MTTRSVAQWLAEADLAEDQAEQDYTAALAWQRRAKLAGSGVLCALPCKLGAAQQRHAQMTVKAESLFHAARQSWQRAQLIRQAIEIELARMPVMEVVQ